MAHFNHFHIAIDGAPFDVVSMSGRETIDGPFRFELTLQTPPDATTPVDAAALVTKPVTLDLAPPGGGERHLEGLVDEAEGLSASRVRVVVVPQLALLESATDQPVFVDKDALEIVETVLKKHGITMEKRTSGTPPKRPHCVQTFVSDLAFVKRLCAEEGLSFFVPKGSTDKVVVTDHSGGFEDAGGPGLSGGMDVVDTTSEHLTRERLRRILTTQKVTLTDYFAETPMVDQKVSVDAGKTSLEHYDYPGGYEEPGAGKKIAALRLEQDRARRLSLHATTNSARLAPGYVVTVDHARRAAMSGKWLVLEVQHEAPELGHYEATFVAVPGADGYRGPYPEPQERLGIETTNVSGPSGAEIHPDDQGCVRVHHRWDRNATHDEKSSGPVRVAQPPTSGGMFIPRIGWEAITTFHGPAGNAPFLLGRLYNGEAPPPSALPGKKVVSAFGTATTPGGGSGNNVTTDDTAGNEGMTFTASKDFNEKTENDKNTAITANDTWTVGAASKTIVGQVFSQNVGGAQSYTVGGMRTVNVTANNVINTGTESVMIGGLRAFSIGGDHSTSSATLMRLVGAAKMEVAIEGASRAVKGASTLLVGGAWNIKTGKAHGVKVSGANTELVSGAKSVKGTKVSWKIKGALSETYASRSIKAGAEREEGFGAALDYSVGGATKMKGATVTFKAESKITIKAGGVTIEITPSEVKIDGDVKTTVETADDGKNTVG